MTGGGCPQGLTANPPALQPLFVEVEHAGIATTAAALIQIRLAGRRRKLVVSTHRRAIP